MGMSVSSNETEKLSSQTEMQSGSFVPSRLTLFICHRMASFAVYYMSLSATAVLIFLLLFWYYGGVCLLCVLLIALLGVLYNAQDMLLYYPEQPSSSRLYVDSPASFGLQYENVFIRSHDGTQLHVQFIGQPAHLRTTAPTFVFFHGNAGNIGHRLPNAQLLYNCCKINVLMVEYRGYGKSCGWPSEQGFYMDGRAALDYLFSRSDICQQKVIVFGRSLGGAVALRVCSESFFATRVAAVIVENTFTSITDMARAMFDFRILHYLPNWCYKNKFPSRKLVQKITIPSLFICGLQDSLVPPRMTQRLYEASGSRMKRLALFVDGTHNDTWQQNNYYDVLGRFLSELEELRRGAFVSPQFSYTVDSPLMFNKCGVRHYHSTLP